MGLRISRILMAGIAAVALIAASAPAMAAKITLRVATESAPGADQHLLIAKFKELAEAQSKGEITIEIFHSGQLGSQKQMQEQAQLGTIQMVTVASGMPELEQKYGIFDFPFLFQSRAHAYKVMDGDVGKGLAENLLKGRGLRVMSCGELGFRQITNSKRPILSADDLKGLKIRVPNNRFRLAAFQALGSAPTPIDYKELYGALQQGVVDGQENPLAAFKEKTMWEVQKYISITNHVFTPTCLLANERWWQGVDAPNRAIMEAAAREAATWQRQQMAAADDALLGEFRAKGVQIDNPKLDGFVERTRPTWKEFEQRVGTDTLEAVLKLR
jgi:tripartite ATP-independent transporter DctP family solute receptor